MKLEDCKKCEFHYEHVADSILCKYQHEIVHRVLSGDSVVSCPIADIKKNKKAG